MTIIGDIMRQWLRRWLEKYWSGCNLSGASLSGADLSEAHLYRANLSGANLSGASLSGADLSGAYLSGADLSGAYLSGASLSYSSLSGANLSGASLSGASLSGAYLYRADLSDAKGIIDLGSDPQRPQYRRMMIQQLDGSWLFIAGCRSFTIAEARAHWGSPDYPSRARGDEYIETIERAEKMAEKMEGKMTTKKWLVEEMQGVAGVDECPVDDFYTEAENKAEAIEEGRSRFGLSEADELHYGPGRFNHYIMATRYDDLNESDLDDSDLDE